MAEQMTFFDFTRPMIKIDKPIRLIELFARFNTINARDVSGGYFQSWS